MRNLRQSFSVALIASVAGLAAATECSAQQGPSRTIPCVAFSPYVAGYNPNSGPHPPPSEIDGLLDAVLTQTTARCISTYGVLNGLDYTFEAARTRGINVTAIIWLDIDASVNNASITLGIQNAKEYAGTITRLSCGSEVRTRHGVDIAAPVIRDCIARLRAAGVSQPITSIDTWWGWCNEANPCQQWDLVNDVDWIGINIFPWWENRFSGLFPCTTAAQAADFVVARREDVASRYPGTPVTVTEFGWPAGPDGYSEVNGFTGQQCGTASISNQQLVIDSTVARFTQLGLAGIVFAAFREPWKIVEGAVGPYWGLLDTQQPVITTQPLNQTVAAGATATFTAAAKGIPTPSAQWQVSTNGGTSFSNITGATSPTYFFSALAIDNGKHFRVVFSNSLGSATSSAATLTLTAPPTMSLDKTSLVFTAVTDGTALLQKTSSQLVRITQAGTGTVSWTASSNAPWLVVSPASGHGSATLTISVQFAAGLTSTQNGAITLTLTGASNTAGPVAVTLNTLTATAAAAPVGSFDTPADGITGVAGSIGVTGWSLDDVEVTRVRIFRSSVAGEAAGTLVFIGDAVFVDGARPDVQASFPNMPRASRAGWGYLMLTNFLPGLGNGTFTLHAVAEDADGHSVTLGTKTITCSNSSSTAPFGAIDTPAQGEVVTSASLNNFGWVLSPGSRKASPPDGGTVRVVVDGAIGVSPTGWTSRSDLMALFPVADYSGIGNALGVTTLDMTSLANGVHTISWLVTDNLGSASGIGSRYFTVNVGSGVFLDPSNATAARGRSTVVGSNPMIAMPPAAMMKAALESDPIAGRRGFDPDAPLQRYSIADGRATMQSEELDRIELHLGGTGGSSGKYVGYLRVGNGLAALPAGSALNVDTGEFTWHPGVAFVGVYDFVFARVSGGEPVARRDVRVVLNPKGSGRVGPQTIIDVADGIVVAGWAADLDSQVDSGVDVIHVWAYPADRGDPIFVGAAAYGGARPDVAAVYGDRFAKSGYGIRVTGLAPGTYDIAVFAYSTVRNGFAPAKTVRVTVQ